MPQDNWETIFENQVNLRKELIERIKNGNFKLKFNRPYLIVSDIASQFYSEAKLELNFIFGKVETKEQKEGTELHERMAEDSVAIKFKELMKTIPQAEQLAIIETPFIMKFQDEFIIGKPDIIIFKKGIPIFLFEYKFSKYSTTYPNQRSQGQIYCQFLKDLGYNTDLLWYGIILAPRDLSKKSDVVKKIPREVMERIDLNSLIQKKEELLKFERVKVFLYKFDSPKAIKDLNWALKFWKGKRNVKLSVLLRECQRHERKVKCAISYSIVQDLVEKFSENIISIYGIGSFFDRKLPKDWIKNDIDMICVVKNLENIPKLLDWTEVRKIDYKKDPYSANVFFNSLKGLKRKEIYEKESWANYKWALMDFKIPQNSVLLYGKQLFNELPEFDSIPYDYEDLLRHAWYHLNACFAIKNEKTSTDRFTKGVFKSAFLLCVYYDKFFHHTSTIEVVSKINQLVKDEQFDTCFYEILLTCVEYRRGVPFSEDYSSLRICSKIISLS